MDRHPSPQSTRFTPFQTKPAQFLRNIGLRTRARIARKKPDPVHTTNPVANAVDNRPRAHSAEIFRKPTVSPTIPGYRLDDTSNPTDTDESSQDVPPCDTSHPRHSMSDRLVCFVSAHSAPSASCSHSLMGDQIVSEAVRNTDAASSFLPNASAGAMTRSANDCSQVGPVPSQHVPGPGQSTVPDQTPPPPETTRSNDTIAAALASSVIPSPQGISPNTVSSHLELTAQRNAPPEFVQGQIYTSGLPAPFRTATPCGAQLSPAILPRQPFPVLDLPPFLPSTSAVSIPSKQAGVKGVPSLFVHGRSNADHHDTAYLSGSEGDESDEGDELEMGGVPDAHQSDESDEEAPRAGPSTIIHRSPAFEMHLNVNGTWSSGAGPSNSPSASRCVTVVPTNLDSKSFSKSVQFALPSPSTLAPKAPRVEASGMSDVQDNAAKRAAAAGPSCKTDSLSELRPSLYRIASRSMIDFGTNNWGDRDRVGALLDTPSISCQTAETTDSYDTDVMTRRFRRSSIPNYHHPTSDPPPYPSFNPRPKAPREGVPALVSPVGDETRERLPAYSNSLYLMAVMPRKMEFIAPGVQAKDRKWRRVLCELEGTVFRVYKCPPGTSGAGILGDWWERQVGVGDVVGIVSNNARSQAPAERSRGEPREVKVGLQQQQTPPSTPGGDSTTREGSGSHGSSTGPSSRATRRASGASFLSSFRPAGNPTRSGRSEQSNPNRPESQVPTMELLSVDLHDGRPGSSSESINHNSASPPAQTAVAMPPPRSASRLSFLPSGKLHHRQPNPSKCDLIRAYTLQNAESGLGNDYIKRRNVIRVRLEGEQFLLQAPDVPSVVEWIEALHAGTNIALDLDQRTMPRGPMFPRRRRRRNRRPEETSTTTVPTMLPL